MTDMNNKSRVVATVEVRMGSTRLPGKVMKEVLGRPLLSYLMERLKQCKTLNEIIVATTVNPKDDVIESFCKNEGYRFYRGSEDDVLKRVVEAASLGDPDVYVEISGDCPLIDPKVVDRLVAAFLESDHHIVTNVLPRSFPAGQDCVVCSFNDLKLADNEAKGERYREHVMLYILETPERFSVKNVSAPKDSTRPWLRILVDYPEDFKVIETIIEKLYPHNPCFKVSEIIELADSLSLARINNKVWPDNVIGMPPREMK